MKPNRIPCRDSHKGSESNDRTRTRETRKALWMAMERMLPDFVKSCRETGGPLLIHQDAFAVDYNEYELLGMAIKFAGLHGKEVRVVGKNRDTLSAAAAN